MAKNNNNKTTYGVEFGKSNKEYFPLDKATTNDTRNGVPKNVSLETMKKLGKYSKNLFKSAGKLSVDVIGQYQPNISNFANSMSDVAKLATAEAKERFIKMKDFIKKTSIGDKTSINDYVKSIEDTKKDIINRLKTGEFYRNSSDNIDVGDMFGDFDLDGEGFDFDLDDDSTGSSYSYSDPETLLSDEPFGDSYTSVSKQKISKPRSKSRSTSSKLANKNSIQVRTSGGGISAGNELVSSIISDVGQAIINQQNSLFEKNFAASELRFTQHIETQRGILSGVNATVEHLQSVESVSSSATMEYQGKMINFQQEQIGLLKEIKEATILGLTPPTQYGSNSSTTMQKVLNNGSLNANEYWKNIKNNANTMLMGSPIGMMASMLPMLGMMNDMGIKQKADPMSAMLRGLVGMSLSSKTKAKLSIADDMMKNAGSLFIGKMNDLANSSNNPFLKNLGKLFGVKDAYVKQADYGLKDPNKIVGWTAKSDRTLNEVIPDRLGEIISALTGKEKEHYDYRSGQFVTQSVAASEYRAAKRNAYSNAIIDNTVTNFASDSAKNADLKTLNSYNAKNSDQLAKELEKDFQKIRMNIGKTNSMFNPARLVGNNTDHEYYKQLTQGIKNPESLTLFINQYSRMSSVDAANFNGQIINQNNIASRALQSFSDDAILYGGATSASSLQNLDEADALEYQLKHSSLYNESELKNQPDTIRAQRRVEIQNIKQKIRRLRSNSSNGGNNGSSTSALSQYGFSLPSTSDAGGNISTTVGNIFNLLANGIVVYTRDGRKKLPPHLTALHKAMKTARADQEQYAKDKALADQAMEEDSISANAELNRAMYMRSMATRFGAPSMLRDMLGLNKTKNNFIDKGFNKGFDVFTKFVGKNFAGGVDNSMNDLIDSTYGKNMAENSRNTIASITSKIESSKASLKSLEGKNDPLSSAMKVYHQSAIKVNTKLIERYKKQSDPSTATSFKDDIMSSSQFNSVKETVIDTKAFNTLNNAVSSVKTNLSTTVSDLSDNSNVAEKVTTTVSSIFSKMNPSEEITEEELENKVSAAMVTNGMAENIESAKKQSKSFVKKIYNTVKDEKKGSAGSNKKPNAFDFKNFFAFASIETNTKTKTKRKSNKSSVFTNIKDAFGSINLKNPFKFHGSLSALQKQIENISNSKLPNLNNIKHGSINKSIRQNVGNFKEYAIDKFFTTKEINMDEVEEEHRVAMSSYATLESIEQSLKNIDPSDMKADKEIKSAIKTAIKEGTLDKAIGDEVIDGIKNYKVKGYPPMFALTKMKEAIRSKYDKKYKKIKNSNSIGAKMLKSIGKWTGTAVGSTILVASGHPFMAAALLGNSLRTNKHFQNMMKKKADKNNIQNKARGSLLDKATSKYGVETSRFDKLLGINAMDRMSKKELENEENIAASTFAAITEIENQLSNLDLSDKKADKEIIKMVSAGVKQGSIDKTIGEMIIERMHKKMEEGKSPIEALGEAKEAIQKNYSKVFKKQKRRNSLGSKILKGFGKGIGIGLTAMYNPTLAAIMIGREVARHKALKSSKESAKDRDKINGIMGRDSMNKTKNGRLVVDRFKGNKEESNEKEKKEKTSFFSNIKMPNFNFSREASPETEESNEKEKKEKTSFFSNIKMPNFNFSREASPETEESNEKEKKEKTRFSFFNKKKKPGIRLDNGEVEGSYADQLNDAKKAHAEKEKEKKEKEKISLFANISTTLHEIKVGLGIRDKGDEIDEKDDETLAGKMEQIRKETKQVKESVRDNTTATVMSSVKGGGKLGRGKWAILKDLVTVGGGVAVTASVAMNAVKAAKRAEEEGGVGVASQLTGLDKSSESNYNYDGTKKQADFHLGGENGVDIDLDRGFERTHNGALIATNAKRWVGAGKRLAVDAKTKAGGFMAKFGKNAAKAAASGADDVAEAVVEKGGAAAIKKLPKTVLSKIKDGLTKFLSNKKVAKHISTKQAKGVIDTIMRKLSGNVPANVAKNAAKASGKNAAKGGISQIPVAGWIAAIAFTVWDFLNGMSKVRRYFKIAKNDTVTVGMRITAGLVEAIPSLLGIIPVAGVFISIAMSMLPPDWLTQNLYKLFANKEAEEKLKAKQDAAVSRANELGVDADRLNEYENRSWGQNFMDLFRSQKKEDERDAKLLGFETVEEYKEWEKEYKKTMSTSKDVAATNKEKNNVDPVTGSPTAGYNLDKSTNKNASKINAKYNASEVTSASNYSSPADSISAAKIDKANASWASKDVTASPTVEYDYIKAGNSVIEVPKSAIVDKPVTETAKEFSNSVVTTPEHAKYIADKNKQNVVVQQVKKPEPEPKPIVTKKKEETSNIKASTSKPKIDISALIAETSSERNQRPYLKDRDKILKLRGFDLNEMGDPQDPEYVKIYQSSAIQTLTGPLLRKKNEADKLYVEKFKDLLVEKTESDKVGSKTKESSAITGTSPSVLEMLSNDQSDGSNGMRDNLSALLKGDDKSKENTANTQVATSPQSLRNKIKSNSNKVGTSTESNNLFHVGSDMSNGEFIGPDGKVIKTPKNEPTKVAEVKESPFVTNDKILMKEMQSMLRVQEEIKAEMIRHNGVSEDFFIDIMNYFKTKSVEKNKPFLFSTENSDENISEDANFSNNMFKISRGTN